MSTEEINDIRDQIQLGVALIKAWLSGDQEALDVLARADGSMAGVFRLVIVYLDAYMEQAGLPRTPESYLMMLSSLTDRITESRLENPA